MERLTFVTLAVPGTPALQAVLLASSIREFGGALAGSPIRVLVPEVVDRLSREVGRDLTRLGVEIVPFAVDPAAADHPFAGKVAAAAVAERQAGGETGLLAWLDRDTIVLREPARFLLPATAAMGYRPVHHRLIGVGWGDIVDPFWDLVYSTFAVPEDRQFPMTTHVGERIRPYLNAGAFVVRPQRGLLARWWDGFLAALDHPEFVAHCERSELHAVFLHQAVLTAIVLADLEPDEMHELGPEVNYPLHLHEQVPAGMRPAVIDDLTTVRYEDVFADPRWSERFPMSRSLRQWLESQPLLARH